MTTKEKVEVMQAYLDGEQIQTRNNLFKNNLLKSDWVDITIEPSWDWIINDYRIKPEDKKPTYRPYEDTCEMIADYKERFNIDVPCYTNPLIWVRWKDGNITKFITAFREYRVTIEENTVSLDYMYEAYVYLDGSPVGKLVE